MYLASFSGSPGTKNMEGESLVRFRTRCHGTDACQHRGASAVYVSVDVTHVQ